MFWPPKMLHSFIQNCCCIILQISHHQWWKTCIKMELIFWGAYTAVRNRDWWLFGNRWRMGLFYFLCTVLNGGLQRTQVHAHNTRTHKGLSPPPPIWNTCLTTVDTIQLLNNTFLTLSVSLSLCCNGHFPGKTGLASVYYSTGWWRWWVVTTGLLEL